MINDKKAQLLRSIHDRLYLHYGVLGCPLLHETPFQLLIAVLLSAQCKDDRVNMVTPQLFEKYPDAAAMSQASAEEIGKIIQSLGLWRNKAENMVKLAQKLVNDFNNTVPQTMEELTSLAGVGRKSANVVLGNAFNIPGFPVDTHVQRLMKLFKLAKANDTPEKIEDMTALSREQTDEILERINELEEIAKENSSRKTKWEKVKPIIAFALDKGADVAVSILSLVVQMKLGL